MLRENDAVAACRVPQEPVRAEGRRERREVEVGRHARSRRDEGQGALCAAVWCAGVFVEGAVEVTLACAPAVVREAAVGLGRPMLRSTMIGVP